ncbi:uncharacterized protein K452DRAFT_302983 [Aplosporella prunicola CBS 121167]|uniref:Protein kinase domain-containing protein n=1 Tax=Aplosporella prunicola CBS 121167 TaxID=1176127 RepID=A0A6A6AW66_9PEZI|nr:uncharacterized protein K452DRAFT_302983 [Aplosporella prunicola CBS 121167]KAF2136179.1 hypothetical protein K452DRAFT_302983 [Aplosporella prunicola CBS 121167]
MANKRQCTVESILRGKIEEAKKGVKEFPEKRFVILEDLQRIWQTGHRDEFYTDKGKDWYRPFLEDCITSKLLRIMSILIMLRFNRWDKFGEIFLGPDIYREHADEELPENRRYRPKRCDDHLPFKREDLVDEGFLGMEDGEPFFMLQGNFCPLVIEERHEPYDLTPDGEHFGYRLPFLHRPPKEFASGASAKVFKEIIPPNHIRYFANLRPSTNFQNKAVACKRVLKEERFDKELNNLKELRRCLSQHSRIMVNIATIIEPGSKEPILHILYDLAAYDLNTFLTVELKERSISPLRRHDSAPPGRNGSDHYTAEDLIWESHNLADALDFLHYRLLYDEEVMCAHNDLKPNNILVFFPDSNDRDQRYPVGLWKIADFGISRLKDRKEGKYLDARHRRERSGSFSRTTSKREPGTYTAPEVKGEGLDQPDARYGDIWSFGCILSEILAFAVGGPVHGPKLVNELGRELLEKYEHQRFYDDKNKVKSELMPWLRSLPQKAPRREARDTKWVNQCADLIYNILNAEEPKKRPKAKEICDQLREIKKDMTKRTMKQPQKQTLIPLDGQIGMEEPDGDTLGMGSGDTEDGNPTIEFSYADSSCVESPANDDGIPRE